MEKLTWAISSWSYSMASVSLISHFLLIFLNPHTPTLTRTVFVKAGPRHPSTGNGLQKAISCSSDKFWSHCQWPHRLPEPHNCHSHSEGPVQSSAGSPATVQKQWAPNSMVQRSLWITPLWSLPLCSYYRSSSLWLESAQFVAVDRCIFFHQLLG